MTTTKKRINVSVSRDVERTIKQIAKRDQVPQATKAAELINFALEMEEDRVLSALADARDTPGAKFVSHARAWRR